MSTLRLFSRILRFQGLLTLGVVLLAHASVSAAGPSLVLPVAEPGSSQTLHGLWKFKYVAGEDEGPDTAFYNPSFDVASWSQLAVPAHWELHGFAQPTYKRVEAGLGLYRRSFSIPQAWEGKRVFLRFDGVLYGLDLWINGKPIGNWASSYNPVTFDITDALAKPGVENILAVRVTTRSKGYEFDTNDCWALSGIYRDVTLFALPDVYLRDYTASTTLNATGAASVQLELIANAPSKAKGRLLAPDGTAAAEFELDIPASGRASTALFVAKPKPWTAETPNLHILEIELSQGGVVKQRYKERIGLRQVSIEGGVLKLNGKSIKLRGVNHHDIWPEQGRVATEELMRRDLELIRAANVNFIRTAHYPPHPRLIELCDEMGFYVMDEVPFGFGDKNLTDPSFLPVLKTRASATVTRDKNRPSVIIWSVGNENPVTDAGIETAKEVKRLDPSRPVCFPTVGSYFKANLDKFLALPEEIDVYAPHYPAPERIREYLGVLRRPIIATEYSHSLGLAFDGVQELWELFQSEPQMAGGAVWMFQDQGILRDTKITGKPKDGHLYVWPDETHYYDTAGTDGCDGIVYSDRTPQIDYWHLRKIYSPVRIVERSLEVKPGASSVKLTIENRHDFRSLEGMRLEWALRVDGRLVQSGKTALATRAHEVDGIELPIKVPESCNSQFCLLELACYDETSRSILERNLRLTTGTDTVFAKLLQEVSAPGQLAVRRDGSSDTVLHDRFNIVVDRVAGGIEVRTKSGDLLASGFLPHVGRRFTMAEELRVKRPANNAAAELDLRTGSSSLWRDAVLKAVETQLVEAVMVGDGARIVVKAKYCRSDAPNQLLAGEIILAVSAQGIIDVNYGFTLEKAEGQMLEAGLSVIVPSRAQEFRWAGDGPYAGYPGKDVLNEPGIYHLNSKDLAYRGNRRNVDLAILSDSSGLGLLMAGSKMDVAVEGTNEGIILSHNVLLAGRGNKGGEPQIKVKTRDGMRIAGQFRLVPLVAEWPRGLVSLFGKPSDTAKPFAPYFQSYDQ
jgi:beta-galactosidase